VPANIMATQTHSPVPLISKGLMVKELLHVLSATLHMVSVGLWVIVACSFGHSVHGA